MGSKTLFATDYPIYTIKPFGKRRVVVTGGGGSAKTGVPNVLELYEIPSDDIVHVIHRHTFTTELAMNAAVHPANLEHVAIGVDDKCYTLRIYKEQTEAKQKDKSVQKRKGTDNDAVEDVKIEQYKVEVLKKEQSDFSEVDAFQKAVCFSHDGAHVITGGADGCVRCWEFPGLKLAHKLKGHKKEVDDIACHPNTHTAVSVSRDCHMIIWDINKGEMVKSCEWQRDKKSMWRMRACCFSKTEEGDIHLFTISVPVSLPSKAHRISYLCRWSVDTWEVEQTTLHKQDLLTALAVSNCGEFVAVGSAGGDVTLYSKDLKLLAKSKGAHSVFVTSLCFLDLLPSSSQNHEKTIVLSVSPDKTCSVMIVPPTTGSGTMSYICWCLLAIIIVLIVLFLW